MPLAKQEPQFKTYSLLFCDSQKFLSEKNKVVTVKAINQAIAMDLFLDDYEEQIINQVVLTFCYEEMASKYGYKYVILNESK